MAGPQLAPFYLQRCPLHSCQVDRIEKCPSTKSAACGLRNPYPVSVWCNSVTPCIYIVVRHRKSAMWVKHNFSGGTKNHLETFECPLRDPRLFQCYMSS